MKHTFALILAILSGSAHADWFTDYLIKYAVGDVDVTEYKQPSNGDVWAIWYGKPLKPTKCHYIEYKLVVPCMQAFTGTSKLLNLKAEYPQCFKDEKDIPEEVRIECARLNPPHVASYYTGSRPVYDINLVVEWSRAGQNGSMPKKKIGTVATQVACGPRAVFVPKDGDYPVWWEITAPDGLYGMAYCK
jgi:hypothetical protein